MAQSMFVIFIDVKEVSFTYTTNIPFLTVFSFGDHGLRQVKHTEAFKYSIA